MNFATIEFAVFFTAVFLVYWRLTRKAQNAFLLVASWLFYAFWDWRFLSLILISTVVDFVAGGRIASTGRTRTRRAWLTLSLIVNLGILGYFKYANFFIESAVATAASIGWSLSVPTLQIILPVGISFYTFQTLSYTLDIYLGRLQPTRSLVSFGAFVAFFPQLVAGPIVRAREFLFQLEEERTFEFGRFEMGLFRFLEGLFMKAVVADVLAMELVDRVFADPGAYDAGALWLAMVGYTVQIYADFSGYSSMAIGTAAMLGFEIPENFRLPYISRNFSDFWGRWHMTMSRFFRDYVYIPLGGSRVSETRTRLNLAATTLISGLWHGASWTFVAWGGLHGLFIMASHRLRNSSVAMSRGAALMGWASTLLGVMFAWVLFRAQSFTDAWVFFVGLWGGQGMSVDVPLVAGLAIVFVVAQHWIGWRGERRPVTGARTSQWVRAAYLVVLLLALQYGKPEAPNPFIYFQF